MSNQSYSGNCIVILQLQLHTNIEILNIKTYYTIILKGTTWYILFPQTDFFELMTNLFSTWRIFSAHGVFFCAEDGFYFARDVFYFARDVFYFADDVFYFARDVFYFADDVFFFARDEFFLVSWRSSAERTLVELEVRYLTRPFT